MKLPRYVRNLNGSLYYQRDIPTKLRHLTTTKTFTRPLSLKINEATESAINKALTIASDSFELRLKLITNSDPEAFSATEIDLAVIEFLRKKNLKKGQFRTVIKDPDATAEELRTGGQRQPDESDYADHAIPEFANVRLKVDEDKPLSIEDRVVEQSWKALWKREQSKARTFQILWTEHLAFKDIDINSRDGQRVQRHWNRWIALSGDQVISGNTLDIIHDCLENYVEERSGDNVKGSTIERELGPILSCLRRGSKKHKFGWLIEKPVIKKQPPKPKVVLSHEEQRNLVAFCMAASKREVEVASCILLMMQGGMMTSEIARLIPDRINLDSASPHIVIDGDAKTRSRKRVIPVVFAADYINEHLSKTLRWLNKTTDTNHSKRVKNLMTKATDNSKVSGHCLRHTFKANCEANGASISSAAVIAGWSGAGIGLSAEMLAYGSEGLANSEVLKGLRNTSLVIHRHLLQ